MFKDSYFYRQYVYNGVVCNKDISKYMYKQYMKYNYMWYFKFIIKNSSFENSLKINYRKIIEL